MSVKRFEFDGGVAVCNDCGNEFDCGTGMLEDDDGKFVFYDDYEKLESELAALKKKLEWIPCSERLPEKGGVYETKQGEKQNYQIVVHWFFKGTDTWISHGVEFWREVPEL